MPPTVRTAERGDLPALTEIYNHYVRESIATFDTDAFTVEERQEWFGHYRADGPHRLLLADDAGAVVGYATSGVHRAKPGYATTVETTVYVHPDAVGAGVGRALYTELFARLGPEPLHRACAGIALPNPASEALHRAFGFERLGVFHEVGRKFDRWIDVGWYERAL